MHYLILEKYKPGKLKAIYQRFAEQGRLAPEGLNFVSSWITEDLSTCYQVMETNDRKKLEQWMNQWKDLVGFEVRPVITSQEAKEKAFGGG